jgi:glucose/arabinose dehydrogenase
MNLRPAALLALSLASSAPLSALEPGYRLEEILTASSPSASSRDAAWKPGDGVTLEVSGLAWIGPDRLGVTVRKGEVWFLDGVLGDDLSKVTYHRFASGLHEPLGLLPDGDGFLVVQRTEMTRLRDTDGDGVADEYLSAARGWRVSGNYHGYAYGPERDGADNLWITTNVDMGERAANATPWHGWALVADGRGGVLPMAAGLRSPCGLGRNRAGDFFVSDQQGTWVAATPIHHLRRGAFYTNPEGLAPQERPDSPVHLSAPVPENIPYPDAVRALPEMVPAAVWLPYNKMGRSATDLELLDQAGRFGPFDGQLLVGEFTNAAVNRVSLEQVDGVYQGACFPFLSGFPAAVVRLAFAPDGTLFVGLTNRGWSSLGNRSYGLVRVRRTGSPGFVYRDMRATPDGFDLTFTEPLDPVSAADPGTYNLESYTYLYSGAYGSEEIHKQSHPVESVTLHPDGLGVRLLVPGLRELHVHELRAPALRSRSGAALVSPDAYYTLNRIPHSSVTE